MVFGWRYKFFASSGMLKCFSTPFDISTTGPLVVLTWEETTSSARDLRYPLDRPWRRPNPSRVWCPRGIRVEIEELSWTSYCGPRDLCPLGRLELTNTSLVPVGLTPFLPLFTIDSGLDS